MIETQFSPSGMDLDAASTVAAILQERLADLTDLSLTLKHVHWNVVGPGFIEIHELMDQQTDAVRALVDEVAERITTLGSVAAGLTSQVAENRSAEEDYALGRAPVMAHLGALDKVYGRVISGHREATDEVSETDLVTQDLLIGQTAKLDLNHWFIRAHLEDTGGRLLTEGVDDELDAAVTAAQSEPGVELVEQSEDEPVPLT